MTKLRRTKLIATLGPATDNKQTLAAMIDAGVDIVRLNFSHGEHADHARRVQMIRELSEEAGRQLAVLADLQGPKIRIARFQNKKIALQVGARFKLDANLANDAGDQTTVGIDYKGLPNDVNPGDKLLLDDGRLVLKVLQIVDSVIDCEVLVGGELSNNKGINRQGGGLSADALTEKDQRDLQFALELEVDYIAISFPRNAADIQQARALIHQADNQAGVIAKIERTEAVQYIDEIINAADAVMVARGDLGVELGFAKLPGVQKHIIQRARTLNKAVITATQMLETMIQNVIPTRAEVSDVANAVLDGTDAVMFSAETATGEHPVEVVAAAANICWTAEQERLAQISRHRVECLFTQVDEAIAMSVMYAANHMEVKAIIALTESGTTPLLMSRIRSGIPILGLSRHVLTERKMNLYRGVFPIYFDATKFKRSQLNRAAVAAVQSLDFVEEGDLIILTKGDYVGVHGRTNAMKILKVGQQESLG